MEHVTIYIYMYIYIYTYDVIINISDGSIKTQEVIHSNR